MKQIALKELTSLDLLKTHLIHADELQDLPKEQLASMYDFCLANKKYVATEKDAMGCNARHHYCLHNLEKINSVAASRYFEEGIKEKGTCS